ncbi:GLPGLI family protein [Croceitalea marina]|uniref:GLPGLI family protein n=1 Tax=Croceitalea marina TaxID=1775166 RepID=A0ABW5MVB7_9FLAO
MRFFFNLFSLIFSIINIYAFQDSTNVYQIEYERTLTLEKNPKPLVANYEYTKFIEINKSLYGKKNKIKTTSVLSEDEDDDSILYFTPSGKNVTAVYKDYNDAVFYSKHEVAYKYFVVQDSLDIFNWNIEEQTKEILGFKCQFATMDFRGRTYEAWFAPKLPVGGPWKYDGLPGMILELKSIDNFIAFKTIAIKNGKLSQEKLIDNPFDGKETLTWNEFKALYKKKALELISYRPNKYSAGIISSRGGIENYIAKDDEEYNKALKEASKN